MRRTPLLALLALAAALVIPTGAAAATKKVTAGPLNPKALPPGGDTNAFYRKLVTVHVGDKVRWRLNGFHTITFPAKGKRPPAFITPDPAGTKVSGQDDAAGAPFWFNGQTRLVLGQKGAFPVGGKTYNGKKLVSSGAPLANGRPKPVTIKFTKAGTYQYYCTIHPGMRARVKVVRKGKAIPSAAADRRAAKREFARNAKRTNDDAAFTGPPGNQVDAGHDTIYSTMLRFFPAKKTIPVGGTLTLALTRTTSEIHTFSFGPADYLKQTADAFVQPDPNAGGPGKPVFVFNPMIAFPSDPPPALPPYTGANHGNGFFNTGILDQDPKTPNPASAQVRFTKAGTYNYICLIHPDMQGQIVVG